MKKELLTTMALAFITAAPLHLHAQSNQVMDKTYLVVSQTDGSESTFGLETNPVITYGKESIIVTCNGDVLELSLKDVADYHFKVEKAATNVELIKDKVDVEDKPHFSFEQAEFKGLKPRERVAIFSINGQLVKQVLADELGVAAIEMKALPKGIYIIKTARTSIKITNQ